MFFKGTVIAKDKAIAAALYRKAMEMGSSDARARLAMMYYHGDGEICFQLTVCAFFAECVFVLQVCPKIWKKLSGCIRNLLSDHDARSERKTSH